MGLQHENPGSQDFLWQSPCSSVTATSIAYKVTGFEKESSISETGMIEQLGENAFKTS